MGTRAARTHADHIMALMDWAAQANLNTPLRSGFLQPLPDVGEVMVAGDLHGHMGSMERLIEIANLQRHRSRHLVIHELVHELYGDEEEGACRSYRLVEVAARLKVTFPNQVHYLLGNHEFSEVVDLEIGKNGRFLNEEFRQGLEEAYAERWTDVKRAFKRFWRTCPLAIRTKNRLFISHSTPRSSRAAELDLNYLRGLSVEETFKRKSPVFYMLWGRDYSPETADALVRQFEADVFIVGHTPCPDGVKAPNHRHVILDSTTVDAKYVILPLDRPLSHADVLRRVKRLF